MPMGLYDGVLLSIQICSIGQWGKILVMVMGFVGTFEHSLVYIRVAVKHQFTDVNSLNFVSLSNTLLSQKSSGVYDVRQY